MNASEALMDVDILKRDAVQRMADIMGGSSAAAQALVCVERDHGGAAEVCQIVGRSTLVVVPHDDLIAAGWTDASASDERQKP